MSLRRRELSGHLGRQYAYGLGFVCAYALACIYGAQFRNATGVSPFWPGAGVLMAWYWLLGFRQIPLVIIAIFLLRYSLRPDFEFVESAVKSLVVSVGSAATGEVLRKVLPIKRWWTSLRDVLLFAAIALVSCLAIGVLASINIAGDPAKPLINVVDGLYFGLGDFIGCLICAPLIALTIGVPDRVSTHPFWEAYNSRKPNILKVVELAGQAALVLVCSYLAFGNTHIFENNAEHLLFLPMLWIVYRNGIKGAVYGGFSIAFTASVTILLLNVGEERLAALQIFLITILLTGLALGVLISGREESVVALEASQLSYQLAAEAAQDGLWEFDIQAQQVHLSPAFKRILGDESLPSPLPFSWFQERIPSGDSLRLNNAIERHLTGGEPFHIEHRIKLDSGNTIWIFSFGKAITDPQGRPIRMLGAANDITERKEAEEKIQQLNSELEKRVQERTAELQSANDELASFSYSVSHDLRGPLRSINGFAKLLGDEYGDKISEDGMMYLDRIRAASIRMSNLIDDLLQLSRMGRFEPRLTRTSLSSIASGILDDLRIHAPDRRVSITVAPDLYAMADTGLVRNMLENLLQNAWKFTSQRPETRIEVGQVVDGEIVTFYVRDNGIGFDAKYSAKLFMPFERLHNDSNYPGSGIGLATVAKIVYLHGGRVWAESELNKGTTFYFTLGEATQQSETDVA